MKKTFQEQYENAISESSLSRIWTHNEQHDCAALTAFRTGPNCGTGTAYTAKENAARNKSLLAKLKAKGYGVTTLSGTYPEGGSTKKETSFFVVDLKDKGKLEADVKKLGEQFEQDSVLIIPKGAIQGEAEAFLVGTNHCDNNWLGYGKTEKFTKAKIGYDSPIYTSKVNGRPFIFESYEYEVLDPGNGFGAWSLQLAAQKDWTEFIEK